MRKPKIAIYLLALATVLWAARPVALADGIEWLTLENAREAVETAPEPGERSSDVCESQEFTLDETDNEESLGIAWLTSNSEASDEDPDEALAAEEVYEPEPEETPEWLTLDEAPVDEALPTPEEPEEKVWLTQDRLSEPEEAEEVEPEKTEKSTQDSEALMEVTVPANGEMVINPHRLPVTLGGREVRDQIINIPQLLTNRSDVPIIVTASVTVDTGESGGLTVTDDPISKGETDKLACLYVEFQNVASEDAEAAWSGGYTGAANQLLVSGSGTVSKDVLRVEAGDKIPTYASYRLFGSLTENPAAGWQAGDKLSVTVSFAFRPAEEGEPEEETETTEEPAEAAAEPVETAAEAEEIPEMKGKADAKPEEAPVVVPEPRPEPDPGPEPETNAAEAALYERAEGSEREEKPEEKPEPSKRESEGLNSYAAATNPDWMRPPE